MSRGKTSGSLLSSEDFVAVLPGLFPLAYNYIRFFYLQEAMEAFQVLFCPGTVETVTQFKVWHKYHKLLMQVELFICFGDSGKWLARLVVLEGE